MFTELLSTLKNSTSKVSNPFSLSGYATARKSVNELQINEIKSLLVDEKLSDKVSVNSINKSSISSYFTPEYIVKPLCKLITFLGIKGRMLEPSCGNGRFLAHTESLDLDITAVELDPVMGYLARTSFPTVDVRLGQRFEEADLEDGTFSLVLGNPPYGNVRAACNTKRYGNINIMGFFIIKGLELLHSGGYEIFVVSTWFMDSLVSDGRDMVAKLGQLAFALRLPDGCFKEEGTDLAVDILIFKRSHSVNNVTDELDLLTNSASDWTKTIEVTKNGATFTTNAFFANNPLLVLGDLNASESMFRSCSVKSDLTTQEIENKIEEIGKKHLVMNGFEDTFVKLPMITELCTKALQYRFNEVYLDDNLLIKQKKEVVKDSNGNNVAKVVPFTHSKSSHKIIHSYLSLKTAYFDLVNAEYDDAEADLIASLRTALNDKYESFKSSAGALNNANNKRYLKGCSQYLRIAGLELNYEHENKKEGISESYKLAEILSTRIFYPKTVPISADSPHEALTISLMEFGTLNISRISSLLGTTEEIAIKELMNNDLAYELPSGGYESSIEYLMGDVQKKIDALQNEPKFHRNHEALTKCLPKRVISNNIALPLGAVWLPVKYYTGFINHLFGDDSAFNIIRSDRFHVLQKKHNSDIRDCNNITWGISEFSAADILEATLNGKPTIVYKFDHNGERVIDNQLTLVVQSKADEIKEQFQNWIFSDIDRRTELEDIYNNKFNVHVKRDLSSIAKHLYVDGCTLKPYGYQLEAAFFALMNDSSMWDMAVGSGKSLVYQLFLSFLKKIHPETRAVIVMPGILVGQFASDYMRNFPQANIIVLDGELPKEKREEILKNAVNNSFDALIMPSTSFQALKAPENTEMEVIEEMLIDLEECISANGDNYISTYRLETRKENLESKLKVLKSERNINGSISFDDLNLTTILWDEAQSIKNLGYSTTYSGVRGMGTATGSQVAYDAYIKTKSILNDGGKVAFGTGTTLTNSVLELTTWFRMLAPHLKDTGLTSANVDNFITLFSQPITDFSIDATGRNFKQYTSLKKFINLPELAAMYSTFAYTLSKEELEEKIPLLADGRSRVPPLKNGKVENVVLDISPEQDDIFKVLVHDASNLTKERNMLSIMHDAKCTSLDQRLFDPSLMESKNNVINTAVEKILSIHNEYVNKGISANQLVFCDKGIPNRHRASEIKLINKMLKDAKAGDLVALAMVGEKSKEELINEFSSAFSVYDELEEKLKAAGLRVAVIHDHCKSRASRNKLQHNFNLGHLDILIGSSTRIGAGWNLNQRLVASHDLDLPMTPGMLQQRWGRIIRQQNLLYSKGLIEHVQIITYTTKRTLDSWSSDLLDRKSKQFNAFAKTIDEREVEPVEDIINLDELTAIVADNSLMLERVKLSHETRTIKAKKRAFEYKKHGYEVKWSDMKRQMPLVLEKLKDIKADISILSERPDQLFTDLNGRILDFRRLNEQLNFMKHRGGSMVTIAQSKDFKVQVTCNILGLSAYLVGNTHYAVPFKGKSKAIIEEAFALLQRLDEIDNKQFDKLCAIHKNISKVKLEISKVFDDCDLSNKMKRLKEIDLLLTSRDHLD